MLKDLFIELSDLLALVPGCAIGVLLEGQEEFHFHGIESVLSEAKVGSETLFQLGSVTKTMTATLCAQEVARGKLGLDEPIKRYLPWFEVRDEVATREVTLRHLLTHRAGWQGDVFVDLGKGGDALQLYARSMRSFDQIHPLGAAISYCNSGFILAGALLEEINNLDFESLMRERIFTPLSMESAGFSTDDFSRLCIAKNHFDHEPVEPWVLPRTLSPTGGIVATIGDVMRYLKFHLSEAAQGEEGELYELYKQQATFLTEEYGLGWVRTHHGEQTGFLHGGLTRGQSCAVCFVPGLDLGIAVLTNSHQGGALAWATVSRILERVSPGNKAEEPLLSGQFNDYERFAGVYSEDFQELRFVVKGYELELSIEPLAEFPCKGCGTFPRTPSMSVEKIGDSRLMVREGVYRGATLEFIEIGEQEYVFFCGRLYRRR